MKKSRFFGLAVAMAGALALSVGSAGATGIDLTNPFDHATRSEVKKEVNRLDGKIDGNKVVQDKVNSQVQGQIGSVNADLQASKAAGNAAYNELKGTQHQQQGQINAVQGAAQTANDRATALEGRADATEGAIRETNAQVAVTDARSINNSVRLDGVEKGVKDVNVKVDTNKAAQDKVNATQAHTNVQLQSGINTAQFTADVAYNNTVVNDKNIRTVATVVDAQGKVIANHETRITSTEKTVANHETRIGNTEKVNARQDVTLNEHTAALKRNDQQWTAQGQLNNEYGQRLDNQEAMSSRFAGDLGNLKSEVAGMNDRINSADRKAEKALNAAAGALSVASIQFNTDVEAGFQVGAGVATLAGKNAAAVGVGGAINKNWFVSGYVTQASSASGGAVSATYSFGR